MQYQELDFRPFESGHHERATLRFENGCGIQIMRHRHPEDLEAFLLFAISSDFQVSDPFEVGDHDELMAVIHAFQMFAETRKVGELMSEAEGVGCD